jgi:hypothetical protein
MLNKLDNGNHQLPTSLNTDHDLPSSRSSTNDREYSLIIKPEAVDGRWSVPGLSKNVAFVMDRDPYNGDVYIFITKSRKTAHLLTEIQPGFMADLKVQSTELIKHWPDKKTDRKNEVVVLTGKEKTDFLELFRIEALS